MAQDQTLKPIEILLVEDNPGDVQLTREALEEGSLLVNLSVMNDGAEAMAFLHRRGEHADAPAPDLILLDLNLPKKGGREVLQEIKADADLNPCGGAHHLRGRSGHCVDLWSPCELLHHQARGHRPVHQDRATPGAVLVYDRETTVSGKRCLRSMTVTWIVSRQKLTCASWFDRGQRHRH